jgi:hypothetical protein
VREVENKKERRLLTGLLKIFVIFVFSRIILIENGIISRS